MKFSSMLRAAAAGALLVFGGGGASAQHADPLAAFQTLERGQWQLRAADGAIRKICLTDFAVLLQLQHNGAQCQRFVLENTARTATVRYTCTGRGNGRSTLKVETPRLISLETQGVADGSPFAEQYEGRLIGRCG